MARLVLNHSTHVPGLIPVLERLTKVEGIQTITPGVIGRVKGHIPRMQLRISVPIRGDLKLLLDKAKLYKKYLS